MRMVVSLALAAKSALAQVACTRAVRLGPKDLRPTNMSYAVQARPGRSQILA
jgi:hypothetical protein